MMGFCPYIKGLLKESECHHDGYCSDCPHNTKDDTISRQAAIDVAKEELDNGTFYDIPSKIESLPSAQPEPKRGNWVDKSGGIEGAWNYCSICGEQAIDLYDYCPNCGAKMEK